MPDIYFYNPTGEMAIANGNHSYMAPKLLRTFENDLAFVPSFFANENDYIICEEKPSTDFVELWQKLGMPHLNYINIEEASNLKNLSFIRPWSWSPASHNRLKLVKEHSDETFKTSPNYKWEIHHKIFFSRESCNKVQAYIHEFSDLKELDIPEPAISLRSISEVEKWINNCNDAVIKMPWSSSGRGVHTVDLANNKPINIEWVKGALKQQGFITIEPLLKKVKDFSYQFKLYGDGTIQFLGISHFINDHQGHFTGGIVNWPHENNELADFFTEELIQRSADALINGIKSINPHHNYEGYLGIDGIVYEDKNGNFKIHPCLDINWRYNMGNINIRLPKYLHHSSKGTWHVGSFKKGEWNTFTSDERIKKPLQLSGSKITSGFMPLTPPSESAQFGVWMEVW